MSETGITFLIVLVPPPNRAYLRTLIHNSDLEHLEKVRSVQLFQRDKLVLFLYNIDFTAYFRGICPTFLLCNFSIENINEISLPSLLILNTY